MSEIKSKTLSQLADEYGVHTSTMKRWLIRCEVLKENEKREGYIFTPKEVQTIYEKLGEP